MCAFGAKRDSISVAHAIWGGVGISLRTMAESQSADGVSGENGKGSGSPDD